MAPSSSSSTSTSPVSRPIRPRGRALRHAAADAGLAAAPPDPDGVTASYGEVTADLDPAVFPARLEPHERARAVGADLLHAGADRHPLPSRCRRRRPPDRLRRWARPQARPARAREQPAGAALAPVRLFAILIEVAETPTIYEWAGGADAFERWLNVFYDLVEADDLLAPLFGGTVGEKHRDHVVAWWAEVMGGPTRYGDELGGYESMLSHHRRARAHG